MLYLKGLWSKTELKRMIFGTRLQGGYFKSNPLVSASPRATTTICRVGQFHVQRPIWSTSDHDVVIVRGNLKFSIMKVVTSYFLYYQLIPKFGGRQQLIQYIL
ncbi:Hypothetical_protein [Hexamita inflata]|uniref:Hypothetical_protein n=1 Tax=Hexamita inflata TaxID=28002 RepID=A0ABP1J9V5_9EUKA